MWRSLCKKIDMMSKRSTNVGLKYLHLMRCLRCLKTLHCKNGKKKIAIKKSTSAPDDLWPDLKCLEFSSESPVVFSARFGWDGCALNFQTAASTAVSWGRWKVPVTAGWFREQMGSAALPLRFEGGAGGCAADVEQEAAFALRGWRWYGRRY